MNQAISLGPISKMDSPAVQTPKKSSILTSYSCAFECSSFIACSSFSPFITLRIMAFQVLTEQQRILLAISPFSPQVTFTFVMISTFFKRNGQFTQTELTKRRNIVMISPQPQIVDKPACVPHTAGYHVYLLDIVLPSIP